MVSGSVQHAHGGRILGRSRWPRSFTEKSLAFRFGTTIRSTTLRAKWTGALRSSLYCNPSDANCNVANTGPGTFGGLTGAAPRLASCATLLVVLMAILLLL
jgi:hypothetical protein